MKAKLTKTTIIAVLVMTLAATSVSTVTQAIAESSTQIGIEIPESEGEFKEKQRECKAENPLEDTDETDDESAYETEEDSSFNPCNFTENIDNQYFPISKYEGKTLRFAGTMSDGGDIIEIAEEWQVLDQAVEIDDVLTVPVIVTEYEDGKIIEIATDFYAQGNNGVVYFFGEYSTDYEDGQAIGHEGSWLVGDDTPLPGIMMPSNPGLGVGFSYTVEDVPGLVHEKSIVKNLHMPIKVKFGAYSDALSVRLYDFNDGNYGTNYFAPGVGLVKSVSGNTSMELVSVS
ncbi:MAG: hypothetical protein KC444_07120 [Nitrosopumilus sp.]|nr:hypothetical protein [Nitrosopumilus sp.]